VHFNTVSQDCHPAIISKEKFDRVQEEKARRSNIEIDPDGVKRKSTHYEKKSTIRNKLSQIFRIV
jgi:site-specific DNA recombinase